MTVEILNKSVRNVVLDMMECDEIERRMKMDIYGFSEDFYESYVNLAIMEKKFEDGMVFIESMCYERDSIDVCFFDHSIYEMNLWNRSFGLNYTDQSQCERYHLKIYPYMISEWLLEMFDDFDEKRMSDKHTTRTEVLNFFEGIGHGS